VRSGLTVIVASTVVLASCTRMPTPQEANDAVLMLREYDDWAWAVGIALVWADVVLPVPQTAVIAALGIVYGPLLGGLLGSLGLITGGLLVYGLVFTSARRWLQRFTRSRSLARIESVFERSGAWAIVLTRGLPYSVPEAVVFLAGLAAMPTRFVAALTVGSVPTAFAFAAIGAGSSRNAVTEIVPQCTMADSGQPFVRRNASWWASVDARPGWAGKSTAVSLRRESAYAHLPRARSRSARSSRHGR
jgi:uncharacterized membrane protein YdjX (TVP38/TMEM64 family)